MFRKLIARSPAGVVISIVNRRRVVWLFFLSVMLPGLAGSLFADGTNMPVTPSPQQLEDFDPALGFFALMVALVMLFVIAVFVGTAFMIGMLVCGIAAAMTAFGIMSSSMAIGLVRRSPASGLRALFLQAGAFIGVPCGIGGAWVVSHFAHSRWTIATCLVVGALCGLCSGVGTAWVFNLIWGRLGAWVLSRFGRMRGRGGKSLNRSVPT